jgi:hypothetical protein
MFHCVRSQGWSSEPFRSFSYLVELAQLMLLLAVGVASVVLDMPKDGHKLFGLDHHNQGMASLSQGRIIDSVKK